MIVYFDQNISVDLFRNIPKYHTECHTSMETKDSKFCISA